MKLQLIILKYLQNLLILSVILAFNYSFAKDSRLRVAISKGSGHKSYKNYINWVNDKYPDIEVIDLFEKPKSYIDSVLSISNGLLLSGGLDVHPGRFGRERDTLQCEIDPMRDTLEFYIIDYAVSHKMPILGICRGLQIMNVAMGGSLIVDIPTEIKEHVEHSNNIPEDSYHRVIIEKNTLLQKLTNSNEEIVNSSHHQSIDKLGKNLMISAKAADGVVEGIEWKDKKNMSWFLGVQWHPERLINKNASTPFLLTIDFIIAIS